MSSMKVVTIVRCWLSALVFHSVLKVFPSQFSYKGNEHLVSCLICLLNDQLNAWTWLHNLIILINIIYDDDDDDYCYYHYYYYQTLRE